jgi:hypothetical protein
MFRLRSTGLGPLVSQVKTAWQAAWFSTSQMCGKPPDPQPVPISKMFDNFLDGTSSSYLEELERKFQEDPNSIDKTWAGFFRHVGASHVAECKRALG